MEALWNDIIFAISKMIEGMGIVVQNFFAENGNFHVLLPILFIGLAATVIMFGYKIIRSVMWG